MLISSWWRGQRRPHASYAAELGVVSLAEEQAHALGLLVDTLAYRVVRTRFDVQGRPLETADLILPMDRWLIRLAPTRMQ
jgi:DNA-binding GntR family transcriptional regulator